MLLKLPVPLPLPLVKNLSPTLSEADVSVWWEMLLMLSKVLLKMLLKLPVPLP